MHVGKRQNHIEIYNHIIYMDIDTIHNIYIIFTFTISLLTKNLNLMYSI